MFSTSYVYIPTKYSYSTINKLVFFLTKKRRTQVKDLLRPTLSNKLYLRSLASAIRQI